MFKTIRAPIVAAVAVLLCGASAHAAQLAINGGFETGDFTGWEQFPQTGTQTIITGNVSEGTFAANLNADAPSGAPVDNVIKNANIGIGQVMAGQEVIIQFDARGTTANGGVAFAEFFSEIAGGGTSDAVLLGGAPLALDPNPDVWTTFVFSAIAGPDVSGGVTLQLKAGCGAVVGCVADLYFDNVSVSNIPVPAALWLFGSALGVMGWFKRKSA